MSFLSLNDRGAVVCLLGLFTGMATACEAAQSKHPGAVIFEKQCASCHGANGQGVVDGYDEPLIGDRSIASLSEVIVDTMPEEDPQACIGDEARQVAAYIFHEFYSPQARLRAGLTAKSSTRVELVRLTVPQYRNSVADLVEHFTPQPRPDRPRRRRRRRREERDERPAPESLAEAIANPRPGLRAEYYQSKGMNKANGIVMRRVDGRVEFDFGEKSPSEDISAEQFAIVWQGALNAVHTGHYEFQLRTQNGARLYLNSENTGQRARLRDDSSLPGQAALIDAWVSSGKMREPSARVFLLGGRRYPLRLEYFKYKEETASIQLNWKPPHGAWSVLDHRHLDTGLAKRVFVAATPFPADDRSLGYERGSAVSPQWHEATTQAAVAAAAEVVGRLPLLSGVDEDSEEPDKRLKDFVAHFASVAFRRPLTESEIQFYRNATFEDAPSLDAAVRRAILLILCSPHFLYTDLTPPGEAPSQYAIASRLSFALWDSIPDPSLLEAAGNGELSTREQLRSQARRMLSDPRAKMKMRSFFHHWLELEERDLAKDKSMFPRFDENVIADLRSSLEQFLDRVVWSERSDYRELLLADYLVLNNRLGRLYQPSKRADEHSPDVPSGTALTTEGSEEGSPDFRLVDFSSDGRAGVLTHPYLLSAFAYHNNTSPIHRGVFLTRNIVGRSLKPPPIAVAFKDEEFSPDLTMREKITQLTRDSACMACHSVINPLGFTLENYDAVGRWRSTDNDRPVDTKSEYTTAEGTTLELRNARDVARFAVQSESAHRSFVTQLFQHMVKQNPLAYDPDLIDQLRRDFAADDFHIQDLMAEIAVLSASQGCSSLSEHEPKP